MEYNEVPRGREQWECVIGVGSKQNLTEETLLTIISLTQGGGILGTPIIGASVSFTAVPFFVIAVVWFVLFGLSLVFICVCCCCCPRKPYGHSPIAYALSLIFMILFTLCTVAGCVVLYTGQGKFHSSTSDTLDYVVNQANVTVKHLRAVSEYLDAAKRIGVVSKFLPDNTRKEIDVIKTKINSSAIFLGHAAQTNSNRIEICLDAMRLALIILAAVMLFIAFVGFLCSICGLQCLVYTLVIIGWVLVAVTFILCGGFLLLHNVIADACVSMDEWVQNPTAHTALDDILPCVDHATAQQTLLKSKDVVNKLAGVVDNVLSNIANQNFPPEAGQFYFNQSGPPVPLLCNPFNPDLTDRLCVAGEVSLGNASKVWKNHVCEAASGVCKTTGRLTPDIFTQMDAAENSQLLPQFATIHTVDIHWVTSGICCCDEVTDLLDCLYKRAPASSLYQAGTKVEDNIKHIRDLLIYTYIYIYMFSAGIIIHQI